MGLKIYIHGTYKINKRKIYKINFIPISQPSIGKKEIEYVTDAVTSGWVSSLGKYIDTFAEKFAEYCGSKYAVATSNGTTALYLSLELAFLFKTMLPIPSSIKVKVLKVFGASVGNSVVIKPNVNINYPWFLTIGNNCWIGEDVWIDNLTQVTIGNNVCLSQSSYLLTGSHDYKKEAFDLVLGEIVLENGVLIGAKATVCPSVTCKSHSIVAVGSVTTKDLEEYGVYQGNPAVFKRKREVV